MNGAISAVDELVPVPPKFVLLKAAIVGTATWSINKIFLKYNKGSAHLGEVLGKAIQAILCGIQTYKIYRAFK